MSRVTFLRSSAGKAGHARGHRAWTAAVAVSAVVAVTLFVGQRWAAAAPVPFIGPFNNVQTLASTVPKNGDVNPYGTAVVSRTTGALVAGDVLVSNFNNH